MHDITKAKANTLSTDFVNKLVTGIGASREQTIIPGGVPLLRLLKEGSWVFGQKDDAVQDGSSWAVNPLSIQHGYVAWTKHEGNTKNSIVGEVMAPIFEAKPAKPALAEGQWPYEEQRSMGLRCLDGDDEGTEVVYKTNSRGGMRAMDELLAALQGHLQEDPRFPCPVIQLDADHYQHPKHGRIWIPILTVADWATMTGDLASEARENPAADEPEPEPEPEQTAPQPAPAARQKASLRTAAATPEPEQTAPAARQKPSLKAAKAEALAEPAPTARRRPLRR